MHEHEDTGRTEKKRVKIVSSHTKYNASQVYIQIDVFSMGVLTRSRFRVHRSLAQQIEIFSMMLGIKGMASSISAMLFESFNAGKHKDGERAREKGACK